MPKQKQNRVVRAFGGFSLIELLVVISIVALLIAVLLPSLGASREVARRATCASTLRQFAILATVYDQDNKELPPGQWGNKNFISGGVHNVLRDNYSVFEKMTLCPSMERFPSNYRTWDAKSTDLGRLGYYYLAGYGNRDSGHPEYRFGWTKGSNYWPYAGNTVDPAYFPALGILKNPGPSKNLPHDRQFLMLDISYWNDLARYVHSVTRSNHNINGKVSSEGQNMSFLDGHVAWQQSRPNESWKLSQSYYDDIYWNPGFSAPSPTPIYMPPLSVE